MATDRVLSTAEERRTRAISSAVATFAEGGFHATTIADVAAHAGISPAYVSKLFSSKTQLFVAAYRECQQRIIDALDRGAAQADGNAPSDVLHAMGGAYAALIADRSLLMLQVHAQAVTGVPEISAAVRQGVAQVTEFVTARSRASSREVQQFIAFGQLCHLLTIVDAFTVSEPWATVLTENIRHTAPEGRS